MRDGDFWPVTHALPADSQAALMRLNKGPGIPCGVPGPCVLLTFGYGEISQTTPTP
jgi:hypothetical protein